jgi:homoaconitate hydratase
MPQNLVEKIVQKYAVDLDMKNEVRSGEYCIIKPAYIMTHDNSAAVIKKFLSLTIEKVANDRQIVITLDHNIQDTSSKNVEKYRRIEQFAHEYGIDFYPAGRGIGHQIMCEEGYAWPGTLVVASDSHSNMYGGLGCLGTPVVRTDASAIWATGETWWRIPPVVLCELSGALQPGVSGKDVIVTLCGLYNRDEVLNHAVEFNGEGAGSLTIDQRLTIANMTTEWGAVAGLFPVDEITVSWLSARSRFVEQRDFQNIPANNRGQGKNPRLSEERIALLEKDMPRADPGALYAKKLTLDLSRVSPYVSGPDHVKTMVNVSEIEKRDITIDKAYLVSCVNSRMGDLAEAAEVLRGKKVAKGVELYVAAASSEVEQQSKENGDWQTLLEAGAIPLPPGCGPCIGLGKGLLKDGEIGISATNRNFKGRMGSPNAQVYLGSPAVVAASALAGKITAPRHYDTIEPGREITVFRDRTADQKSVGLIVGMPVLLEGEIVYCHKDNLDTDGMFPGKYTYNEDLTGAQMAEAAMENYDPEFHTIVKNGDILVGGSNFGTGSSREQAATALKQSGIQLIIAASFSETYTRNALNNGILTLASPELSKELKIKFGEEKLTVRTGITAKIDIENSLISAFGKEFQYTSLGPVVQELYIGGGIANWIKKRVPDG